MDIDERVRKDDQLEFTLLDPEREEYSFVTWNLNQDRTTQSYEETKIENRWPKILAMITQCNPDILCLQELRTLENCPLEVNDVLHQISKLGYDYKHAYYGSDSTSFALATFYKRNLFFLSASSIDILPQTDATPKNKTRILLGVALRSLKSNRNIAIFNTHLPIPEEEKWLAIERISTTIITKQSLYLDSECNHIKFEDKRMICAGDFNFFDDLQGTEQRNHMLFLYTDLAYPLINASGTFMGYERDEFKKPYERMSRLDHIFSQGLRQEGDGAMVYGDLESVKNRTYPSDHLMISVSFSF